MRVTLPILSIFVAISTLFENGVVEASYRNINNNIFERRAVRAPPNKNPGTYKRAGTSGVSVMHLALTEPNKLVFIDKIEANPLKQRNGDPAISVEFDLNDFSKRVLDLQTDTFCSSGSFLGNGTLVHTGGTGKDPKTKFESGFQSIRFFTPCQNKKCQWFEDIDGLSTKRWYTSTTSLSDGRVIIIGGSTSPTGLNNKTINNPTFEFFPSTTKKSEPFPFLERTLPENLYPVVHLLSGPKDQTRLFVFANVKSIIWDWEKNEIIKELPDIPGPPRSYPSTAASVVLPLRPEKDYAMTVMICGGTKTIDPSSPAENSCGRINLVDLDTAAWEMEDFGGLGRVMPDAVILADGKIMFLNGAGKGTAGFNGKRTLRADNPVTVPVLYDPDAPAKKRFTTLADSGIPRLYHSVATSLPDGKVFITGSNPFSQVTTTGVKFQTEYRNQIYTPPYFFTKNKGATITSVAGNKKLNKGAILVKYDETVKVVVSISTKNVKFTSALAHFGFVTHSTHMSQRYVALTIKNPPKLLSSSNNKFNFELDVLMPPHGNIIPPGNHYLFINNHGVPSVTAVEINIQQ